MNCVVGLIREYKKESLLLLCLVVVLVAYGIGNAGFWFGLASIFLVYFLVGLYIFSTIEPKEWEASIVFVLYLAAAVVVISSFAMVSSVNGHFFKGSLEDGSLNSTWDHIYFSASMFTSLGFSDFKPATYEAQVFAVAQSLLGNAHGVSFILVMLGRKRWLGQPKHAAAPGLDGARVLELKLRQMTVTLRVVVGLLVLNSLALLVLAFR